MPAVCTNDEQLPLIAPHLLLTPRPPLSREGGRKEGKPVRVSSVRPHPAPPGPIQANLPPWFLLSTQKPPQQVPRTHQRAVGQATAGSVVPSFSETKFRRDRQFPKWDLRTQLRKGLSGSPSSAHSSVQATSLKLTQAVSVTRGKVARMVGAGKIWVLGVSLPWAAERTQARTLTSSRIKQE